MRCQKLFSTQVDLVMSSLLYNFKQLSLIDPCDKQLVYGYIRILQTVTQISNIPPLISHTILAFYYIAEYFAMTGNDSIISNDNMTITKQKKDYDWNNTSYCNKWINSMNQVIAKWEFEIIRGSGDFGGGISFGLVSKEGRVNDDFINFEDRPVYCYNTSGTLQHHGLDSDDTEDDDCDVFICEGDTFEFILDLIDKTVSIKKSDEEDKYIIFENIEVGKNIKYKMVVSLCVIGYETTLKRFTLMHK